jgi:hypothetical protein
MFDMSRVMYCSRCIEATRPAAMLGLKIVGRARSVFDSLIIGIVDF